MNWMNNAQFLNSDVVDYIAIILFLKACLVVCWSLQVPRLTLLPFKPQQTKDKNTTPVSLSQTFFSAAQSGKIGQDSDAGIN